MAGQCEGGASHQIVDYLLLRRAPESQQVPVIVSAVEQGVWPAQPLLHQGDVHPHPRSADGGGRGGQL